MNAKCPHCGNQALTRQPNGELCCLDCYWQQESDMNTETIKIDCDERGFTITIDGDSVDPDYQAGRYTWRIADPEAFYDHVKAAIGPWLYERDQAFAEFKAQVKGGAFRCDPDESGGYDTSDPKHPDYHSTHADIWDARAGK